LHPKFDIQGMHKIVNLTIKDQTMWLVDVWAQFVCNLEEAHRRYEENADECQNEQFSFKVGDQVWLRQQHIKTTRPLQKLDHQRLKFVIHCETN
jgi:hypothetical protein